VYLVFFFIIISFRAILTKNLLPGAVQFAIVTRALDLDVGAVLLEPWLSPDLHGALLFVGSIVKFHLVGVKTSSYDLTRHRGHIDCPKISRSISMHFKFGTQF